MRTLLGIVLAAMAATVFGQVSNGTSALPTKTVENEYSDPTCSMADVGHSFLNERATTCAQGQTNFFNGEVRYVDYGTTYVSGTPYNGYELTSCACASNGTWTRTMGTVTMGASAFLRWTWQFFGRNANCSLTLKRDLVVPGCSATVPCDCGEGFHCGPACNPNCVEINGCISDSPILVDVNGDGQVRLTNKANGVRFDLDSNGEKGQIPWFEGAEDGWLVLNGHEDGNIVDGRQLFGDRSAQGPAKPSNEGENGYRALRGFDDNGDDVISPADGIWGLLGIWRDANHNGISEGGEVQGLTASGIASISLRYLETRKKDRHGNEFRYRAEVILTNGKKTFSWDVFLTGK